MNKIRVKNLNGCYVRILLFVAIGRTTLITIKKKKYKKRAMTSYTEITITHTGLEFRIAYVLRLGIVQRNKNLRRARTTATTRPSGENSSGRNFYFH